MSYSAIEISGSDTYMLHQLKLLQAQAFGEGFAAQDPVLGERDEDIVAGNLHELVTSPSTVMTGLINKYGRLVGFSLAVPIESFNPQRLTEAGETAYVYWTMVDEPLRGQGLVGTLQSQMHSSLIEQGYLAVEGDVMIENGYAAKVIDAYSGTTELIEPHCRWEEIGYQARVRIDLTNPDNLPS